MKKTLSVSLGGRVYAIEEDAYKALDAYVDKIRAQFKKDPNVDELVADMEAGMADAFEKQKGKRKNVVLTLADVEAMIGVMGAPEEIAEEEPVMSSSGTEEEATGSKRLYRDTDDVVIAGVCSGIAAYFNMDPVIVRIGFILFAFVNGIGILAYLLLWAAMPKAETTAQKLEMRGKPVNLSEIEELVKEKAHMMRDEGKKAVERLRNRKTQSTLHNILQIPVQIVEAVVNAVKAILRALGPLLSVFVGSLLALISGAALLALSVALGMLLFGIQSPYIHSAIPLEEFTGNILYPLALGSAFVVAVVPLILLMTLAVTCIARRNTFRGPVVAVLAVAWLVAIGTTAGTATHVVPRMQERMEAYNAEKTVTHEFPIEGAVETLRITGNAHLRVVQGDVPSAVFRSWEEDTGLVHISVEDGELYIDQQEAKRLFLCLFCQHLRPRGELVLPALTRVIVENNSDLVLEGFADDLELVAEDDAEIDASFIDAGIIRIQLSDDARATLDGTAAQLYAHINETARLHASDFRAETVEVTVIDQGHASVRTSGVLTATAQDLARIIYRGNPATSTIQELDLGRVRDAYETTR